MQPGERVADRYRLERLAGRGGMGAVFKALDEQRGETVAVKLSFGREHETARRLTVEAEVLARLTAPGIVRYRGHGHDEGYRFLVLEWLEGEDLDRRLGRQIPSVAEALALLGETARTLDHLHQARVIHADLKPANLFLVEGAIDRVKLIDFGASRLGAPGEEGDVAPMGTPHYMAPEQAAGSSEIDARTDVYGLGCILFECLTGRPPFDASTLLELLRAVMTQPVPAPSTIRHAVPPEVERLCLAMLAKDPDERPDSAGTVADWLAAIARGTPLPTDRPDLQRRAVRTLMGDEQSLVSVLVLVPSLEGSPTDQTVSVDDATAELAARVTDVAASHGARAEMMAGASFVVIAEAGNAPEARLARCALALSELAPLASLGLATGHATVTGRWPLGDAIDAASLLAACRQPGVLIDATTRSLLDERFAIRPVQDAFRLEAYAPEVARPTDDGPLFGRDTELASATEELAGVRREREPGALLVTGPAGCGKSRLVRELLRRARGATVFVGRGDALAPGDAFGVIKAALRRVLGLGQRDGAPQRRQQLRQRLARFAQVGEAMETFLGVLLDLEPEAPSASMRARWLASQGDAAQLADEIRRAFTAWLAVELEATEVLVFVVEDLHWADPPSLRLVGQAMGDLAGRPLFVLASAREEPDQGVAPPWPVLSRLELAPLGRQAAVDLVRARLGADLDEAVVARVVQRAEGNPFFLGELARAAASGQVTSPDTVLSVARRHFDRLSSDARRVLRAASVYGDHFWPQGLAALLGPRVAGLIEDIFAELAAAEIIERRPGFDLGGEPAWGFRHALLRDAAYGSLSDDDRPIAHRLAATWLEHRRVDQPARLAELWRQSDRPQLAAPWYQRAAERALEGCDHRGALAFVALGLEVGASGETRGQLLLAAAEAHEWRGNNADREACATEARKLSSPGSAPWFRAFFHQLAAKARMHGREGIAAFASELLALPTTDAPSEDEVVAIARVAELFFRAGASERGTELEAIALERAGRLEHRSAKVEGFLAWVAAWRALNAGDVQGAYERDAEAARAFERAGEARLSCHARSNVGYEEMRLGLLDQARQSFESALATAERLGMRVIAGASAHNLGLVYGLIGRVDDGIAMEQRAIAISETIDAPRTAAACHDYLARLYLMAGRADEAVASAHIAVAKAEPWPDLALAQRATRGRALAATGRIDEALHETEAAMAICGNNRSTDGEDLYVAAARLEVLAAAGEEGERKELARWAQAELDRQAQALGSVRAAFLEKVPEHVIIMRQSTP